MTDPIYHTRRYSTPSTFNLTLLAHQQLTAFVNIVEKEEIVQTNFIYTDHN